MRNHSQLTHLRRLQKQGLDVEIPKQLARRAGLKTPDAVCRAIKAGQLDAVTVDRGSGKHYFYIERSQGDPWVARYRGNHQGEVQEVRPRIRPSALSALRDLALQAVEKDGLTAKMGTGEDGKKYLLVTE